MGKTKNTNKKFASFKRNGTYIAGLPGYPRNFSRDVLLAGLIADDEELLTNQLEISARYQGLKSDPITGEEPGKIHHEFPGIIVREPYLTTYNASDTTALYLIAIAALAQLNPVKASIYLIERAESIQRAIHYIRSHIKDGIFWEYPPPGAARYSLNVTYWKDSVVPKSGEEEPTYPVCFALNQFQAANALYGMAQILDNNELFMAAEEMYRKGIEQFIRPESFCVMKDKAGHLEQVSSDELHCLRYIPTAYASLLPLPAIKKRAATLFTDAGIACTPRKVADALDDKYHGYVVWPFEQALIHAGCLKFDLIDITDITERCVPFIDKGQELLEVEPEISPGGNDRQLWSVAAKYYFQSHLA